MGIMDFFSGHSGAYDEVESAGHKATLSHELIAGAAAFEAAKAYEKHCTANGKPDSHAKAKEFIAAAAGAYIDRVIESKGLDFIDAQKAKHEAKKRAEQGLSDSGEY